MRLKPSRTLRVFAAALLALACASGAPASAADQVTAFAAASLTNAMQDAATTFEKESGSKVVTAFDSSSILAKQIENGAPAQVFASADEKWMNYLQEKGLIETDTRSSPISNQLVLIAPVASTLGDLTIAKGKDFLQVLKPGERIAVGDPDHVPAGIYAKEALKSLGLWSQAEPRLARADNVRAALALVERAETPLGIVYKTDALISKQVKIVGTFPPDSHTPITYPFAIVKGQRTEEAVRFLHFLTGNEGAAIFERYGFKPTGK
jgi:molybdate transport system substrate-binding protein